MCFGFQIFIQFRLKYIVNILEKESYSLCRPYTKRELLKISGYIWLLKLTFSSLYLLIVTKRELPSTQIKFKHAKSNCVLEQPKSGTVPKRWYLKFLVSWQVIFKTGMVSQMKNVCLLWQKAFQKIQIPKYQVKNIVIKVNLSSYYFVSILEFVRGCKHYHI